MTGKKEQRRNRAFYELVVLSSVLLVAATWLVVFAPIEEVMGVVQKIFYFHVPSAMAMYVGVAMCSVSSLVFLLKGTVKWDAGGRVGAELASMFCVIVLITGPIWAHRAWGAYWVWDPRLTSVAVLGLILASYHLVRAVGQESQPARRLAAALGVLAAPNAILIHFAVRMWGGLHPTVIYGGRADAEMRNILVFCICGAATLFMLLAIWRIDMILLRERAKELQVRLLLKKR